MTSSAAKAVMDRLIVLVEERSRRKDVETFLSSEKGFQAEQINIVEKYSRFVCFTPLVAAIHYVAGRNFETSEEADEWLSYLAVYRNQNFDERAGLMSRSPLHCACKWGSIFGVEWLVCRGANLNVKDDYLSTPYSLALESFTDRMKKLLLLEEHGYSPSPDDLCSAADHLYSSPEEAREILHHLVCEKGLSANAINELDHGTPLHSACESGDISQVEWLVEHNAALNSINDSRSTPFMLACESSSCRLSKVRYLSEKGADISAKDEDGKNALFYAVDEDETPKDEVEGVLRFLVVERCMDINSADETGETVFMKACSNYASLSLLSILLSLGADKNAQDHMGRNAFHRSAGSAYSFGLRSCEFLDYLNFLGVDVTCEDNEGMAPYEVADDPSIRTLLKQYYDDERFAVFVREKVRPDSVKMCVMGSEMAGKTTFVNSLLQLNLPPIDPKDRTAGIEIHSVEIPGVGKGTIWDFGAQSTFQGAHGLFFRPSNTMLVLVLCFRKRLIMTSEVLLLQEGRYWCAFAKASLPTSHKKSPIRLSLVFNSIGVEEDEGTEVSFQLKRVALLLQEDFRDTFTISNVIEIDCSKSQSVRMKDCREKLKKLREEILEAADDVPKLCHAIEKSLSSSDEEKASSLSCFMTPEEFRKWVAKDVRIYLSADERKISVEFLDSSGIIVDLKSRICLRPIWLCRNVIGPLLAPPYFPFGMPAEKFGTVSKDDIESALRAFENDLKKKGTPSPFSVTVEEALQILLHLELCIKVKNATEVYQIPALLQGSIPSDTWNEDTRLDMYRGQRYECVHTVDIISPSSFVVFQSRCFYMPQTSHKAWKDGVKLVRIVGNKVVECLVNLGIRKEHCCIDVVLRWSTVSGAEDVAKTFLGELKQMIVAVCNEKSPGVRFAWFYLDSAYLKRLDEDPAIYLSSDVDMKVFENALDEVLFSSRPKRSSYSAVKDLVIMGHTKIQPALSVARKVSSCRKKRAFKKAQSPLHHRRSFEGEARVDPTSASSAKSAFPTDEHSVTIELIRACAAVKGSKWEEVGVYLLSVDDLDEIRKSYGGNIVRMVRVLESWNTAKSPTVGQLLKWFERVGVNRSYIERKYAELLS